MHWVILWATFALTHTKFHTLSLYIYSKEVNGTVNKQNISVIYCGSEVTFDKELRKRIFPIPL